MVGEGKRGEGRGGEGRGKQEGESEEREAAELAPPPEHKDLTPQDVNIIYLTG
jgi:hypothetical protein